MAPLALALVDHPRASLNELARAVGISKATLYRVCRTREQVVQQLMAHCVQALRDEIRLADLGNGTPVEALRRLLAQSLEHRELHAFLIYYWKDAAADPGKEAGLEAALDAFFLRGQREGAFRIDVSAPALTEIWITIVIGLIDAERRGRVARMGLTSLIESIFLNGALAR
ncbi:TetR/AcrR family transcriptional regulator [Variovorax sp. GB1P17]|uniref:TetR/AcrR family transcriptional regulator n=1 Tax=Variovorax sp. GB1P17 TaxID=3443740 RepID=UPI003F4706FF